MIRAIRSKIASVQAFIEDVRTIAEAARHPPKPREIEPELITRGDVNVLWMLAPYLLARQIAEKSTSRDKQMQAAADLERTLLTVIQAADFDIKSVPPAWPEGEESILDAMFLEETLRERTTKAAKDMFEKVRQEISVA
ncbi:hypothetical protein [Rhodoblastus sp.]|uniref:hypothetical protein n=1 Tax=Rhodoblastus sp. TaxID=1962975 RepID=UPI003F974D12